MAESMISRVLAPFRRSSVTLETNGQTVNAETMLKLLGLGSDGGNIVTPQQALSVPAVWSAVNFLSRTLAGLPLHVFKGDKKQGGALGALLNHAANDGQSSTDLFRWAFDRVFVGGRAYILIERDAKGEPVNLFPLPPGSTKVQRTNGVVSYVYGTEQNAKVYPAADVIDLAYMRSEDLLSHYSPILACAQAINASINARSYGGKVFKNGGMPVFMIEGPFRDAATIMRAEEDLAQATADAYSTGKTAIALPGGHKITSLAIEPQKLQMVDFQRFLIEEVARIYQLPPVFVQDLTHGTFSNTEQQDLHFTKHVVTGWTTAFEAELNLKLFGRENGKKANRLSVKFNVDGLLRGDYKTRTEGHSTGVNAGVLTPNEARALENRPPLEGGDKLYIQGATVPLEIQSNMTASPATSATPPAPAAK